MRSAAFRLRAACVAIVVIIAAFLFAYPTQSLLAQQHHVDAQQAELATLQRENRALQIQSNRLTLPAEIERVARQEFNMVRPNEQAFSVVFKNLKKPKTAKP